MCLEEHDAHECLDATVTSLSTEAVMVTCRNVLLTALAVPHIVDVA